MAVNAGLHDFATSAEKWCSSCGYFNIFEMAVLFTQPSGSLLPLKFPGRGGCWSDSCQGESLDSACLTCGTLLSGITRNASEWISLFYLLLWASHTLVTIFPRKGSVIVGPSFHLQSLPRASRGGLPAGPRSQGSRGCRLRNTQGTGCKGWGGG